MKKLRKSAKALIISVVSAVCVLAIVLGCIFGLRKPAPTPPAATAIDLLGEEINNSIEKPASYQIFEGTPYADVPEAEDGKNIKVLKNNFFIIKSEDKTLFYIYRKNSNNKFDVKNLTSKISDGGFVDDDALSFDVKAYNDEYLVIENQFSNDTSNAYNNDMTYTFVYFGNFESPTSIYKLSTIGSNTIVCDAVLKKDFCIINAYENFDYEKSGNVDFSFDDCTYIYKLNKSSTVTEKDILKAKSTMNKEINEDFYSIYEDDYFAYSNTYGLFLYDFSSNSNKINYIEFENKKIVTLATKIVKNKFFVEYKNEAVSSENSIVNESDGVSFEYSYSIVSIENNTIIEEKFNLNTGYAKAEAFAVAGDKGYYFISQQKKNSSNQLENNFYNAYYNNKNEIVVSYSGTKSGEIARFYKNNHFVTNFRILKFNNNLSEEVFNFANNENSISLETNEFYGEYFVVKGKNYGIMNYSGKFIVDPENSEYISIKNVVNGFAIAETISGFYLIDCANVEFLPLENYYHNDVFSSINSMLGLNFYLMQEDGSDTVDLFYENRNVMSNISNFKFLNTTNGVDVVFESSEKTFNLNIVTNKNVNFGSEYSVEEVETSNQNDTYGYLKESQLKDSSGNSYGTIKRTYHGSNTKGGNGWEDTFLIEMNPGYALNGNVAKIHFSKTYSLNIKTTLGNGSVNWTFSLKSGQDPEDVSKGFVISGEEKTQQIAITYKFTYRGFYFNWSDDSNGIDGECNNVEVSEYTVDAYFIGCKTDATFDNDTNKMSKRDLEIEKNSYVQNISDKVLPNEFDSTAIYGATVSKWYINNKYYDGDYKSGIMTIPNAWLSDDWKREYYKSQPQSTYDKNTSVILDEVGKAGDKTILKVNIFLNVYYWAYYEPNIYEVHINNNGGIAAKDEGGNDFNKFYMKYKTGYYKNIEKDSTTQEIVVKDPIASFSSLIPTRFGYTFDGYYTQDGTQVVDKSGNYTQNSYTFDKSKKEDDYDNELNTKELTITARWVENKYKLSFELGKRADGGILTGFLSESLDPNASITLRSDLSSGTSVFKVGSNNLYYPSSNGASIGRLYTGDVEKLEYYKMKNAQRRVRSNTNWYSTGSVTFVFAGSSMYPVDFTNWVSTGVSGLFDITNPNLTTVKGILELDRSNKPDTEQYYISNKNDKYGYAHYPRRGASSVDYYYRGDIYSVVEEDRDDGWKEDGYSNWNYESSPQISVVQSQYIFDGWAYLDREKNKLVKINNNTKIKDALQGELWIKNEKNEYVEDPSKTLTLYALYREKDYNIQAENEASGGSVSVSGSAQEVNSNALIANIDWDISFLVNNAEEHSKKLSQPCNYIGSSSGNNNSKVINYGEAGYVPKGGQNITVSLNVNQNNGKQAYKFGSVNLKYFGYCTNVSSQSFAFANLIFEWTGSYWIMYNADSGTIPCSVNGASSSNLGGKSSKVNIVAGYTYKFGANNGNYPVSGEGSYNYLTFSNLSSTTITFTVHNAMIAGGEDLTKGASQAGEYGFTCSAKVVSNFNTPDTVSISNGGGSAEVYYLVPKTYKENGSNKYASSWFNGIYSAMSGGSGYYYFNGTGFNSVTLKRDANFYYDGENLYYMANPDSGIGKLEMNFGSTEFIAIRPSQSLIKLSNKANDLPSSNSVYYDLNEYLSSINIGGELISFEKFNRTLSRSGNYYYYSNLELICNKGSRINNLGLTTIKYLGTSYEVCDNRLFSVGGRSYILVLAKQNSTNEVMYFIYTDMAGNDSDVHKTISLGFTTITSNLSVTTNFPNTDKYNNSDAAVLSKYNGSTYNVIAGNTSSYKPTDMFFYSIAPADGYLINSITIKIKNKSVLFNTSLNHNDLDLRYSGSTYSYPYSDGGTSRNGIRYSTSSSSTAFIGFAGANTWSNGYRYNGVWFTGSSNGNWSNSITEFETLYFMVAGLYDDLEISVDLISYSELILTSKEEDPMKMLDNGGNVIGLGNLTIAVGETKIAYNEVQVKKISVGSDFGFRIIFLGNAAKLKNGVTIYVTGENYSYKFDNFQYYSDSTMYAMGNAGVNGDILSITTPAYTHYRYGNIQSGQINAKKYIIAASLSQHSYTITSKSYLKNQLDNKGKTNSWFNDTVLSNIDYSFFTSEYSSATTRNWQSSYSVSGNVLYTYNGGENNITQNDKAFGYGVTITYREIPGYRLAALVIGNTRIEINNKNKNSEGKVGGDGIHYKLTYNTSGEFVLSLYYVGNRTVQQDLDSIKTAIGDKSIDFYSEPYTVVLSLNKNVGSASSASTYQITNGSSTYTITYDTLTQIPNVPTMTGYTFVGWASQNANKINRLKNGVWNSSSKWTDIRDLFTPDPLKRSNLLNAGVGGNATDYDFYVKDGYFITDTGFSSTENYNFWKANAGEFVKTVGSYGAFDGNIRIPLYAIWKANTYRIEFDLFDARLNGSSIETYGSTSSQLGKRASSTYSFGTNCGANDSRVILAGNLKANSNTYYAYVTFDSNDWYISTSKIAFKSGVTSYVKDNMLDFVVDRYGYSWLGWTSKSMSKVTSGSINNSNTIFASSFNNSKTSKAIVAPKLDYGTNGLYNKLQSDRSINENNINPEFYYAGTKGIQNGYSNKNVVFYFYEASGTATSDFLNIQNGIRKTVASGTTSSKIVGIAYFDTSLNASSYSFVSNSTVSYSPSKYRSIRLYAYWQANAYTFDVNFRDDLTNIVLSGNSTRLGSSVVTNKDGVQNKLNSVTCYFDDATYAEVINSAVPVRIGYDFVGWSYRFGGSNQDAYYESKTFTKNNFLNQQLLSNYNTSGNSVLTRGAGADINAKYTSFEGFGDSETSHVVYIFAIWKSQKFTVNFSLNIGGENLKNLYDLDSTFAVALYNSSASKVYDNTYSGINQTNFINVDSSKDLTFGEIVANVVFTATFDDLIENSYFEFGGKTYYLKDLFATSAGYYFLGWLTDPSTASSSKLVSNTSKSKFDEAGNLVNVGNVDNNVVTSIVSGRTTFNLNMFNNLMSSNYKLINSSDTSYFLNSNKNALKSIDASGTSTNYGYVTINGQKFYIAHEFYLDGTVTKQRLYYIKDGEKIFVQISERNNDFTPKGEIAFDDAFLYLTKDNKNVSGKYIIRFCDTYIDGNNAYYINSDGEKVELLLRCRLIGSSWSTGSYTPSWNDTFVPCTTRQFSLYADWAIRTDLVVDISNGNNGKGDDLSNQDSSSNFGLAGHFHVTNKDTNENKTTASGIETEQTLGYAEKSINIGYDYYQGLKFDIIPYFNGRYLSEMKLTYHVIEWLDGKYVKVPYILVLKFTWSNTDSIMRLNSKASVSVYKSGNLITPEIELSTTGSATSSISQIIKESSALTKLSMIDRSIKNGSMQSFGFVVDSYANNYSSLENTYGRRDVNKLSFELENVGSEIEISCKFSVQTFDVKIYNLFDNNGNTLTQREEGSSVYDTEYTSEANFLDDVRASSTGSFGPLVSSDPSNYQWTSTNGKLVRMATISTDCADESIIDSYNVPYGYFLYGIYYNSDAQKPTDKREGDVRVNVNQPFGGYEYIYANGNYYSGTTSVKLETVSSDEYYMQNTPTLGSRGAFPEQSFMLNLTTYQFLHWFEYTPDSNGNVVFTEYDEDQESKYLNRNLTLYGYYFSQNKPTSVQFYTWDKDAYKYTELNSDGKYILNSNTSGSPFKVEGGKVVKNEELKDYVDNDGFARVKTYNEYGVNQVRFGNDNFRNLELNTSDLTFISKLLRTYWYMEDSYDILYFVDGSNENVYIKYNTAGEYFYYENASGNEVKIDSINSNDLEYFTCTLNGDVIPLQSERRYVYQLDGSKMYIKIAVNGNDRYYELKPVTDEENSRYYAGSGSLPKVMDFAPRYYADINGSRYYMMLRNQSSGGTPDRLYNEAGSLVNSLFDTVYTVDNIDDYYVVYEDVYSKIEYVQVADSGSSIYINPYTRTSHVTIKVKVLNSENEMEEIELPLVFDYQSKNLEQDIADTIDVEYKLYTAVNDNYSPSYSTSNDKWEITGITISKLPSPNSGSWYEDNEYGFVSFIKFTDTDLEQLRQRDETSFNTDQQRIYAVFAEYINNRRHASLADLSLSELEELKNSVSTKISEYTMRDLLSKLITVSKYIYGTDGQINKLIASIPITFEGLKYSSTAEPLTLTVTVNYKFDVVRARQTKVDDNIYAIPIYSPYVMQFGTSASTSGSTVSIDLEKTRVSHFEVSNGVHIYNDESDPLNFVVLTADQYAEWISVSEHPDGRLTTLLSNNNYVTELGIQYKLSTESKNITFNFAGMNGEYYIVMFYYKYSSTIPIGSRTSVTRVSDDIIKVSSDGSSATIQKVNRGQS